MAALELLDRNSVVLSLRRLSPHFYAVHPAPNCCTVAILFPRPSIPLVAAKLSGATCKKGFAKDSALDDIKKRHGNGEFQEEGAEGGGGGGAGFFSSIFGGSGAPSIEPNLVRHIGFYSTLRKSATVDPFSF